MTINTLTQAAQALSALPGVMAVDEHSDTDLTVYTEYESHTLNETAGGWEADEERWMILPTLDEAVARLTGIIETH